jgi:hypothetical protein
MLPDPGDDLVLETAVNGQAEAVITFPPPTQKVVPAASTPKN